MFLGIVADSADTLCQSLETIAERLQAGAEDPVGPQGRVRWEGGAPSPVAFLFPGQGSQEPNMLREVVLYRSQLRRVLESAERVTAGSFEEPLGQIVYPPSAFTEEQAERQRASINATHVAQPAIGALSLGLFDVLRDLGVESTMMAGHSYGELTALCAAGAMSRRDFFRLSEARGRAMAQTREGAMAAVNLGGEALEALLSEVGQENKSLASSIVVANRNAPKQSVLSGPAEALEQVIDHLKANSVRARMLPVTGAFHSSLMEPAAEPLRKSISDIEFTVPSMPVFSNQTAEPYPSTRDGVGALLSEHLLSTVDFVGQIEAMYEAGARVFVEVGPGRVLKGLVGQILGDSNHTAVSLDAGNGLKGMLLGLAEIEAAGIAVDFTALFEDRECRAVDLQEEARSPQVPATLWYVDGGRVRTPDQPFIGTGELPLLSYEQVQQARERKAKAPVDVVQSGEGVGSEALPQPPKNGRIEAAGSAHAQRQAAGSAHVAGVPAARANGGSPVALQAYEAYQETMRRFLATQEAVMARVLGAGESSSFSAETITQQDSLVTAQMPESVSVSPPLETGNEIAVEPEPALPLQTEPPADELPADGPPAPAKPGTLAAGPLDRQTLTAALTTLVSERTGYPEDTLDEDLDLEADLGVDSIKRLEILDATVSEMPDSLQGKLQDQLEDLVREKTLSGWAKALEGLVADVGGSEARSDSSPVAPDPVGQPQAPAESVASCRRYIVQAQDRVLEHSNGSLEGPIVLTEDELGIAQRVAASLEAQGVRTQILERGRLSDPGGVARWLEESGLSGPVGGIAHLAPIANGGAHSIESWRARTEIEVKSLFDLLQSMGRDGRFNSNGGSRFRALGATILGGAWGRIGSPAAGSGVASSGGVYGVLKTLASEHEDVLAKVVDFDQTMDPEAIGQAVLAELMHADDDFEIGYSAGRRQVYRAELAPIEETAEAIDLLPQDGWVVLVTGGARGITAELSYRLAAPGVRFVIIGRSPRPGATDPSFAGLEESELRAYLIKNRRDEGQPVRPAEIERQVTAILKESEARENLARLEAAGAVVDYRVADVRSELESAIDSVYERFGRLDAVLHGAGVVEDKLLMEKSRESFDRVFDTKADSSFALARKLRPRGLKWVVLMSSISGRIGNQGQVDYAAGNEVMNRVAWQMSRELAPARVLAINWGPWIGAGMANPGVIRELANRGIAAIDLETGWQFLRRELLAGSADTVEVIAGSYPGWG